MQNKLLYAITQHTAAEIVVSRADPDSPNMALTWKGSRVRKQDVIVAKNYLAADEVDTLNRLVVIFLEDEMRGRDGDLPSKLNEWEKMLISVTVSIAPTPYVNWAAMPGKFITQT